MDTTDALDQAVDSLLAIEPEITETDEVEVEEADEEETLEEETDEADEDEGEEPESEEGDEDEEDDGDEQPQLHTVKVDGEEVEVTLDDLKRSYSAVGYAQKRMQQAAEAKKEAEGLYQTLQLERQQFLATVQNMQQQGIVTPPQAPNVALLETDPIGYMQEKAAYDVKLQEFQNQQRQLQGQQQRQQQLQQQAMQMALQEQARKLTEAIPEFANPETAATLKKELVDFSSNYGLSAEEVASIADARYVQVLYDAYKFRQLQSGKDKAKQKPKPPRNVKPKPRRAEPQKVVQSRKLQAARKSGKPEAFIDLLLE